jgi:hypothetical protein
MTQVNTFLVLFHHSFWKPTPGGADVGAEAQSTNGFTSIAKHNREQGAVDLQAAVVLDEADGPASRPW